jgi:hypothetical protein
MNIFFICTAVYALEYKKKEKLKSPFNATCHSKSFTAASLAISEYGA